MGNGFHRFLIRALVLLSLASRSSADASDVTVTLVNHTVEALTSTSQAEAIFGEWEPRTPCLTSPPQLAHVPVCTVAPGLGFTYRLAADSSGRAAGKLHYDRSGFEVYVSNGLGSGPPEGTCNGLQSSSFGPNGRYRCRAFEPGPDSVQFDVSYAYLPAFGELTANSFPISFSEGTYSVTPRLVVHEVTGRRRVDILLDFVQNAGEELPWVFTVENLVLNGLTLVSDVIGRPGTEAARVELNWTAADRVEVEFFWRGQTFPRATLLLSPGAPQGLYPGQPVPLSRTTELEPVLFVDGLDPERSVTANFLLKENGEVTAVYRGRSNLQLDGTFSGRAVHARTSLPYSGRVLDGGRALRLSWAPPGAHNPDQTIARVARRPFTGSYWTELVPEGPSAATPLSSAVATFRTLDARADVDRLGRTQVSFCERGTTCCYVSTHEPVNGSSWRGRAPSTCDSSDVLTFRAAFDAESRFNVSLESYLGKQAPALPYDPEAATVAWPIAVGRYRGDTPLWSESLGRELAVTADVFPSAMGLGVAIELRDATGFVTRVPARIEGANRFFGDFGRNSFEGWLPERGSPFVLEWFEADVLEVRSVLHPAEWDYCMSGTPAVRPDRQPAVVELFEPRVRLETRGSELLVWVSFVPRTGGSFVGGPFRVQASTIKGVCSRHNGDRIDFRGAFHSDGSLALEGTVTAGNLGSAELRVSAGKMRTPRPGGAVSLLFGGRETFLEKPPAWAVPFVWVEALATENGRTESVTVTIPLRDRSSADRPLLLTASQSSELLDGRGFYADQELDPRVRDFAELRGCVSAEGVDLQALAPTPEEPEGYRLSSFLGLASPTQIPKAGNHSVRRIVKRSDPSPDIGDIWHLELETTEEGRVSVRYLTPEGEFKGEVRFLAGDYPAFQGLAGPVFFSGVFAPLPDHRGHPSAGNFPIVQQFWTDGAGDRHALDDATGEYGVLWIPAGTDDRVQTATYPTTADAEAALARLKEDIDIEVADMDRWRPSAASVPPNDPSFQSDPAWRLQTCCVQGTDPRIRLKDDAWNHEEAIPITVAVLDSGVADHRDLLGRLHPQLWYLSLPPGTQQGPRDTLNHGTRVAGLIAAHRNNGLDIAGANSTAMILPVQVIDATGQAQEGDLVRAMQRIRTARPVVHVVNASFHRDPGSVFAREIRKAIEDGIVVVAAAGNCTDAHGHPATCPGRTQVGWPAAMGDVLSVGASKPRLLAPGSPSVAENYSQFGKNIDLYAPGSVWPAQLNVLGADGGVTTGVGTSLASPFVAATAAMILAREPTLRRDPGRACDRNHDGKSCVAVVTSILQRSAIPFEPGLPHYADRNIHHIGHLSALHALLANYDRDDLPVWDELTVEGCRSLAACTRDGVRVRFRGPYAPLEPLEVSGYIVYIDGVPQLDANGELPTIERGDQGLLEYVDRSRIQGEGANALVAPGEVEYSVSALHRNTATRVFSESMTSTSIRVRCSTQTQSCEPVR